MPHDHHDHLSPSGHPYRADDDIPLTYWQTMEIAVRELLIEKGITTAQDISAEIDRMASEHLLGSKGCRAVMGRSSRFL